MAPDHQPTDVLVVGTGVAGTRAAETLREQATTVP
jgi:succinate dehydrogenase/fumarate reductase flavoprotein subunit